MVDDWCGIFCRDSIVMSIVSKNVQKSKTIIKKISDVKKQPVSPQLSQTETSKMVMSKYEKILEQEVYGRDTNDCQDFFQKLQRQSSTSSIKGLKVSDSAITELCEKIKLLTDGNYRGGSKGKGINE